MTDFGTGGLGVSGQRGQAWITKDGRPINGSATAVPAGPCTMELTYDLASQAATLGVVDGVADRSAATNSEVSAGSITVTGLWADPALIPGISVQLDTQVAQIHTPPWRWALTIAALALAIGSILLLVGWPKTPSRAAPGGAIDSEPTRRWSISDTVAAALLGIATIIVPPNFDDGWVLATVRQFDELGFFSNYYTMDASAQPQGFWWTWLEHLWLGDPGTAAFALRIPCALLLLWSWWFLRRRVLDQIVPRSQSARAGACAVYLAASFAFLITLRPEPLIALLLCVQLALVVRYSQRRDPWVIGAMGINGAIALAAHQAGWTVILCAAGALPGFWKWALHHQKRAVVGALAIIAASSAATFIALVMLGTNWTLWRRSIDAFTADPAYGSLFNESQRVNSLFDSLQTGAGRIFVVGVILLSILAFLTRRDRAIQPSATAGWAAVASASGLLLTSSKVPNHLGVLAPAAAVLTAITVAELRDSDHYARVRMAILAVGLAIAGYVAVNPFYTGSRNTDLLSDRPSLNAEYPWKFFAAGNMWFWVVVLAAILAITFRLGRRHGRLRAMAVTALASTCSLCVGLSLAPVIAESGNSESWIGQQFSAMGGEGCGLAGTAGLEIPTSVAPLPQAEPAATPTPLVESTPTVDQVPSVGSYPGIPVKTVAPGGSGLANSAWFAVGADRRLSIWTRGNYIGVMDLTVNYRDGSGALTSSVMSRPMQLSSWQIEQFQAPDDARQVQISWDSAAGPTSVSVPWTRLASTHLAAAAQSKAVWVGPAVYLQAPCLTLPSIATGIATPFEWSLGTPGFMGATPGAQLREMDCPGTASTRWNRCAMAVSNPAAPNVSVIAVERQI